MLRFFKKLKKSEVFKNWKRENKDFFLCGCFSMFDDNEEFWQFDFYNKKKEKMTSFKVDKKIEIVPDDDVFSDNKDAISEIDLEKVKEGDILIAVTTHPDYVPAMRKAAAIVTDEGGITSHAAIVSREFGLPCIVGTKIATKILNDGDLVEVDANNGTIKKLN